MISASDAANGVVVTVTFTPAALTDYSATVTLSSNGAEDVVVNLSGQGIVEGYAPVMQPANSHYIDLTQFRADWTDLTPAESVSSYTLEVKYKYLVELLSTLDGFNYTGNYTQITLTEPWGGMGLYGGNNGVYIAAGGNLNYTIPEGYNNATFTVKLTTATHSYGAGNFTVATPQTAAVGHNFEIGETYTWLVTASSGEKITFTSTDANYSPDIALLEVYSGDATSATLRAVEEGDDKFRVISGITDKFYTVNQLLAEGTFLYRVKALYIDGTESAWSNVEEVTLFQNGHGYEPGDVNHSHTLTIADVTALINYLLSHDDSGCCPICADVNGDQAVNIGDVTALINMLLTKGGE